MNTGQLKSEVDSLSVYAQSLGDQVTTKRQQLRQFCQMASQCWNAMDYDRGDQYLDSAECVEKELEQLRGQLEKCRSQCNLYERYAMENLSRLGATAEKLSRLAGAAYGAAESRAALEETKRLMEVNRSVTDWCSRCREWITKLLAEDDSAPIRNLKLVRREPGSRRQ